jgi:translation initiation factor 1 (eIF-1/SUI1)
MNPFEEELEKEYLNITDNIEIYVKETGRKKNTYIVGFKLPDDVMKKHLSNIKQFKGCNGSIKNYILHLQGSHVEFALLYFKNIYPEYNYITFPFI